MALGSQLTAIEQGVIDDLPAATSNQELPQKWYLQDLEEWKIKEAFWRAQREPKHIAFLAEEGTQRWRANLRARSGRPAVSEAEAQSQDLGDGIWAEAKKRVMLVGADTGRRITGL